MIETRPTLSAKKRIILALDVPNREIARHWIDQLKDHVGLFKIGLELFTREGPSMLSMFDRIMLDLKFHDIPETVEGAVRSACGRVGIKFFTLHVSQRETLERAIRTSRGLCGPTPLGVTVLTSMDPSDLQDLGYSPGTAEYHVLKRVEFGVSCGLRGFVCSAQEVRAIRDRFPDLILVVPGVRPEGSDNNDQKRVATPQEAVANGADYLVIGRPIRDAQEPLVMVKSIVATIVASLENG